MKTVITKKPNGQILAAVSCGQTIQEVKTGIGTTAKFYRDNEGNPVPGLRR